MKLFVDCAVPPYHPGLELAAHQNILAASIGPACNNS